MDTDEDCEPPIVRLDPMPPPPPPPPLLQQQFVGSDCSAGSKPGCLALLAMSSSSDSSSCSDSDSTSTPSASGPPALACGRCRLAFDTPCAWLAHLQDHRQQTFASSFSAADCSSVLTEVCSAAVDSPTTLARLPDSNTLLSSSANTSGRGGADDADDEEMAAELQRMQRQSYLQYHHHQQQQQQQQFNLQQRQSAAVVVHQQQLRGAEDNNSSAVSSSTVSPEQQFRCPLCGASFGRSQNLESHIRRKHMGAESVMCPDCGKCLSSNSSLKKHLRLHSGEAPFSCDFCRSGFRQKWELEKHLDYSHGDKELANANKPFQCGLCGRAFIYQNSCNAHRRLHQRAYQCQHCGIGLSSANDLRRHELAAHQPQQCWPYACSLCPDRFSRKAHLDAHLAACQVRQRQRLGQLSYPAQHHNQHQLNHHIGEDSDLLRCLLRAVDSSSGSTASAALSSAGAVASVNELEGADPPDLSLLDSVLASGNSIDFDAVEFSAQMHPM